MDIRLRLGTKKDILSLEQLYDNLNDYLENTINYPKWIKGIYPVRQDAEDGIKDGCLFIAVDNDEIVGSMILRHKPEPAYLSAPWQAVLDYNDVLVIYTFVVNPTRFQKGVGQKMLDFAAQYAKEASIRALRLDVYDKNIPAIHLYEKCGFQYIDTVSLGLEHYGLVPVI